jgi:hypothetical protein
MRTAPIAAMEVLLRLLPLHLQVEAEAKIGHYMIDYVATNNGNPKLKVLDKHT